VTLNLENFLLENDPLTPANQPKSLAQSKKLVASPSASRQSASASEFPDFGKIAKSIPHGLRAFCN